MEFELELAMAMAQELLLELELELMGLLCAQPFVAQFERLSKQLPTK